MKKLFTLASLLAISSAAVAGFQGNNQGGGFAAQNASVTTVAQALAGQDHAAAQITGTIVRQLDDDEFLFRDNTGEIKIDVEDNAWQGQTVGANEKITIYGQVDKENFGKNTLDVYRVQKH